MTVKAAVLGSSVSQSLSPRIHNLAYRELGVKGEYVHFNVQLDEFETFFHALDDSWNGFSLTMPLKESAFTITSEISESARRIHSVNTLFKRDKQWHGVSTDESAFSRIFKRLSLTRDSKVAILGAGGTARAALGALDGLVQNVNFYNRTVDKREELERSSQLTALQIHNLATFVTHSQKYDLVISTLPPGISDSLLGAANNAPSQFFECLYIPSPTKLSASMFQNGSFIIDGIDLLIEQALDQIALFSNQSYNYESMRELLAADLRSDFPKL